MIQITYNPASIEDFKEAVKFLKEQGSFAPVSVRPSAQKEEENGPWVSRYLREKNQERFRLTGDEKALMEANGYSREDIAQIRIEGIDSVSAKPIPVEIESEGFNAFFEDDEEEEQTRRDEKHGLYGGKEDSAN